MHLCYLVRIVEVFQHLFQRWQCRGLCVHLPCRIGRQDVAASHADQEVQRRLSAAESVSRCGFRVAVQGHNHVIVVLLSDQNAAHIQATSCHCLYA